MNVEFKPCKTYVEVWVNTNKIGELEPDEYGNWVFFPNLELTPLMYWEVGVLRQIADWIDQKNEAWEKELDIYFSQGVDKDKKV